MSAKLFIRLVNMLGKILEQATIIRMFHVFHIYIIHIFIIIIMSNAFISLIDCFKSMI